MTHSGRNHSVTTNLRMIGVISCPDVGLQTQQLVPMPTNAPKSSPSTTLKSSAVNSAFNDQNVCIYLTDFDTNEIETSIDFLANDRMCQ